MIRMHAQMSDPRRSFWLSGIVAAAFVAGACAGPTAYRQADGADDDGYRTTQLSEDRYLVSFEGNAAT